MRLILNIASGPLAGRKIEVESGQSVRIGRTEKADVATHDSYMSGAHFAVECEEDVCRVRDLQSRNGTLLNKKKISEATLHDGDKIYAGQTHFLVRLEGAIPAPEPQPVLKDTPPPDIPAPPVKPPQEPLSHSPVLQPPAAPPPPVSPEIAPESGPPLAQEHRPELAQPVPPGQSGKPEELRESVPKRVDEAMPEIEDERSAPAGPPAERSMLPALELAVASTPEGRLINILRSQTEPLFALLDAAREPTVPRLLHTSGEAFQSLYEREAYADVAPYLVQLKPSSHLLEAIVRQGWGHGWSVYLTCGLPLQSIRAYFRQNLMIKTPDGREFFSRFYDPRFFRVFLPGCTPAEAKRFFGPISRYFMEAENPDILLQFTNTNRGVEMKERLLLISGT